LFRLSYPEIKDLIEGKEREREETEREEKQRRENFTGEKSFFSSFALNSFSIHFCFRHSTTTSSSSSSSYSSSSSSFFDPHAGKFNLSFSSSSVFFLRFLSVEDSGF